MYDNIKQQFTKIIIENELRLEEVVIQTSPLSPEEAIGNPEDRDYPLLAGKERLMQAELGGSLGQAFTDMYGNFRGRLSDIIEMDLTNNFRRAIFISTLNATMRHLGLIAKSVHCKDNEPRQCSQELVEYIQHNYAHPRVAMVGLQPRMVEALSPRFELKLTDMDPDNIGTEKFGVLVHNPDRAQELLDWCDIALVTGTTIVNNTIDQFRISKPVIFYGITICGAAKLLGLEHFCRCGH